MSYYFVLWFQKFILLLPPKARIAIFNFVTFCIHLVLEKKNKVIRKNLEIVYGESIDKKTKRKIQRDCYKYAGLNILTMLEASSYDKEEFKKRVEIKNRDYIDKLLSQKKPIIIITAHYGNIEVLGYTVGTYITNVVQVQRKLDNHPKLSNLMQKQRESYGLEIVERSGAVRHLLRALKQNKVISLVVDQHVNPDVGSKIKFLGQDAYQTNTPAFLARKFNAAILPVFMQYKDDFNYEVEFLEPFYVKKSDDEAKDIFEATQKQADIISQKIVQEPNLWFWCHKRFKSVGYKYD